MNGTRSRRRVGASPAPGAGSDAGAGAGTDQDDIQFLKKHFTAAFEKRDRKRDRDEQVQQLLQRVADLEDDNASLWHYQQGGSV